MSNRPNINSDRSRRSQRSHQTPSISAQVLSKTASRPNTPPRSRSHLISRESSTSSLKHSLNQSMPDHPVTPNPKKPDRRRQGGAPLSIQRSIPQDGSNPGHNMEQSDEEEGILYDLLGVASPRLIREEPGLRPGLLRVTKSELDAVPGRRGARRKGHQVADSESERGGNGRQAFTQVQSGPGNLSSQPRTSRRRQRVPKEDEGERARSEGELSQVDEVRRKGRNRGQPAAELKGQVDRAAMESTLPVKPSGISATRPKTKITPQSMRIADRSPILETHDSFDISALSRSLPSNGLLTPVLHPGVKARTGKRGVASEDESAVWEMPESAGPVVAQEMTVSHTCLTPTHP